MKTLIIDSSYLIYRSYFAYPNLTYKEIPVGAFFGFAKTTLSLIKEFSPDRIVFACDTPESTWRHDHKKDYKAGRSKAEEDMISQIPIIHNWCQKITENWFYKSGWEADDIIFSIAMDLVINFRTIRKQKTVVEYSSSSQNLFEEPKIQPEFPHNFKELLQNANQKANSIYIFSADKDLYQSLCIPNVQFIKIDKGNTNLFGKKEFEQKYDLSPLQWLDYKALVGDNSDNLKGVDGIGPKTATNLLQQVGSLYAFFNKANQTKKIKLDKSHFLRTSGASWVSGDIDKYFTNPKNAKLIDKIIDNYESVVDTYQLSALHHVSDAVFKNGGFDLAGGFEDFEKYGFKSLITIARKIQPQEEQSSLF